MSVFERLQKAAEMKGVSFYRISKDTGIPQSQFSNWKNGKSGIGTKNIQVLSDYLGVSINYLLYGNEQEEKEDNVPDKIPVLGIVPCGVPIEAIEDIIEYIEVVPSQAKDHFGLIAKGDSMYPEIKKDDILIIKKTSDVQSGKIAIVKVNGDEATCKKVIINENGITLVPLNNLYDPSQYSPEQVINHPVVIIGEVVEIRRRLK